MTKEEILAKSRNENKGFDLVEMELARKVRAIAGSAVLILCVVLINIGAQYHTQYRFPELWAVFFAYMGTQSITDCLLSLRRGRRLRAVVTGVFGLVMLITAGAAVMQFIAALKAGLL